ncbi:hypothetical protein BCM02_109367 [Paenibacillus methanolicus]|uniref:DUF2199 domain-containing protein n=1 Tax=Paenibacillus methanolicus TaxID=582686 RepID=A0A5S5C0E8_9BACL|nr:hypothetical protein BCM02_109367 [Paenibacillus methanolicus]
MNNLNGYTCSCCGEYHDELPTSYGTEAPVYYELASPEEREQRFELSEDLCVMDNEHFFIRGCLEIPIIGTDEQFIWGAWVSLSEANYRKVHDHGDEPEQLEAMLGWFSTVLPDYPDTLNLKAKVHHRLGGMRPYIELEPTEHPLAVESREGMTVERVQEIAEAYCERLKEQLWPFENPEHAAVLTLEKIMRRESPVLYVTHDEEDGMWQFLDGEEVIEEEARLLSLKQMVDLDPSLMQLSDLPPGWIAWRDNSDDEWRRAPR